MYTNFTKLNEVGNDGEKRFADYLAEKGYKDITHIDEVYEAEGLNRSDWDIRCVNDLGLTVTFEIKTQDKCHEYRFANIEQVQYGKPGGISVTEADYFVIVNEELGFGIIEVDKLKHLHRKIIKVAVKKDYDTKRVVYGVQLWITKFKNWAAGWKMSIHDIDWFK